jgi:hypothetical protein
MSFVEFADLARYSDRSTQEVFVVDLLIDVVIGERTQSQRPRLSSPLQCPHQDCAHAG